MNSSDGLEVKIPEQSPLRVILGSSLNIPCYFNIPEEQDTSVMLTPRIKWSKLSNGTEVVLLVATGGRIRLNSEYREVISLPNYPAIPTDATLEIKALRSNHTGIYRCEVMYGIEDRQDTIEVLVKDTKQSSGASHRRLRMLEKEVKEKENRSDPEDVCSDEMWCGTDA
ncbi:hypothetical protein EK904_008652 [Melospiza melodia maxima]|nr:hypothetical protein EK904_008652 [Melospiza melodia maxima]